MHRVALLATLPLLAAGCGSDRVELKPERTLRGSIESPQPPQLPTIPREIRAVSPVRAVIRWYGGRALETRDAGTTWRSIIWRSTKPRPRPPLALPRGSRGSLCDPKWRTLTFYDGDHGLLLCGGQPGAGSQLKRGWFFDSGTWIRLPEPPGYGYVGTIDAVGPLTYVHHSGRAGDLMTTDGGRTWRSVVPPESSGISSWVNAKTGWALNGYLDVFRTRDGGKHWQFVAPGFWPEGETSFCTPRVGYGTGGPRVSGYSPDRTVYATTDGGKTWTRRSRLKLGAGTLTCVGRDDVILSAYPPLNAKRREPVLLRSRDGGRHWRGLRVPRGAYPPRVQSRDVYFAPLGDNAGWITFDGARTWRKVRADAALQSIAFTAPRSGFAVLLRTIGLKRTRTWLVRTDDAGKTWQRVPSKVRNFVPISVIAAHGSVWVGGRHRVLRTHDGGRHWDEIRINGFPWEARFASSTLGVAASATGSWLTRDGGATWQWQGRRGYSYR